MLKFSLSFQKLKIWVRNFPNENLGQEKHFKYVFGVRIRWEFEKIWIKIKNILTSAKIYWFFEKKSVLALFFHLNQENSLRNSNVLPGRLHIFLNSHPTPAISTSDFKIM